eukprot:TRINITY_DN5384_c0_g1_i1.p1 TRINITY_DN5384_c0_g1~~TRINITY_DN5384_c0_g1_i1.p1  ORF type:complete len:521 (-),score=73.68 TRINITY_DN5384_c0_g1_i1:89-1627(-)
MKDIRQKEGDTPKQSKKNRKVSDSNVLFRITPKNLSPNTELKRLFGGKVLSQSRENNTRGSRGRTLRLKKCILVEAKPTWPVPTEEIEMELSDSKDGVDYFVMKWGNSYHKLQDQFYECVESNDPNTIVQFLQFNPYHLDSLLQLCEVAQHTGEHETASEFIERCLFFWECRWHPLFDPTSSSKICRFEFKHDPNRPIFLALFKYMQMLGKRGCSRTALEFCKLILALDPSDALCARFYLDHYALRSNECDWLFEVYDKENNGILPNALLVNMVFGRALAKFRTRSSKAKADDETGVAEIEQAFALFPMVLPKLVQKCNASVGKMDDGLCWQILLTHDYWTSHFSIPILDSLVSIFVERNHALWKADIIQAWLKQRANAFLQRSDLEELAKTNDALRKQHYAEKPLQGVYRHILLSGVAEAIGALPYENRVFQLYDTIRPRRERGVRATTANPLALFLQTLMPWAPVPNLPMDENAAAEGGNGPIPQGWLEAVLQTLNVNPAPEGEEEEEEG